MTKILILGSKGMLGGELLRVFGSEAIGLDREDIDASEAKNLKLKIQSLSPSAIINCIAYNDVDAAEEKSEIAFLLNEKIPTNLSLISNELDIPLIHFSTNYVFDGEAGEYNEDAKPNPISAYGKSKLAGEEAIINFCKKYYIIRTAVLFGKKGESEASKKSFVQIMLDLAKDRDTIKVVTDEVNSLTYVHDLAWAVKVLLSQNYAFGIYHFSNFGSASWYELAEEIFKIKEMKINLIPVTSSEFKRKALRPKKSVLLNTKFIEFRPWQEALKEFLDFTKY